MRGFFKTLQKDSVLLWSFWISNIAILIGITSIALSYANLPPVLPLYNHLPWGYARLGKTYELFFLPLVSIVVVFVNSFLGASLLSKIPLLARFLFLTMVALSLFMLIFTVRLIFVTL